MTQVKICGLSTPDTLEASIKAGARYIGFNFYEKSPRYVTIDQAIELAAIIPPGVCKVGLTVNMDDVALTELMRVPLDMLQLHGSETPERVTEVKGKFGLPVMKAVGIEDESDLLKLDSYGSVADQLLVEAKPPRTGGLPGGNGLSFDWTLISKRRWPVPWMLAGGLTTENVAEAIAITGAKQVDLSSGVESAPGVKDIGLIRAFIVAAQ